MLPPELSTACAAKYGLVPALAVLMLNVFALKPAGAAGTELITM